MSNAAPYRQPGIDLSAAISSVRVAAALNERFAVLAEPRTYREPEELSSVIGEARQLYPQIWSHLDDARTALVRQGVEVSGYDELRASSEASAPGVLDVMVKEGREKKVELYFAGGIAKSARMNVEGHATAVRACDLLRRAMPQVDFAALDRADAQQLGDAGSLRTGRRSAIIIGLIGALVVAGIVVAYVYMRTVGATS